MTTPALEKFTADMLALARSNEDAMSGLGHARQAKFIGDMVRHKDCIIVIYPDSSAPALGYVVACITGASLLAAAGVNLRDPEGIAFNPRPRPLKRPVRIGAILVRSATYLQCMIAAYGDQPAEKAWRKAEKKKDGESALLSIKAYCTPEGFQQFPL